MTPEDQQRTGQRQDARLKELCSLVQEWKKDSDMGENSSVTISGETLPKILSFDAVPDPKSPGLSDQWHSRICGCL